MRAEDVLRPDSPRKMIAVVGDKLLDRYVHGRLEGCQDGCPKFVETSRERVDGGATNAALSLSHASSRQHLFCDPQSCQTKVRFLDNGKIVFRHDYPLQERNSRESVSEVRNNVLPHLGKFDGVYVSDYDKGMIDDVFTMQVVEACREACIPCVVDPKRNPTLATGAILKCNGTFALEWGVLDHAPGCVITHGASYPTVFDENGVNLVDDAGLYRWVECRNHVGAGDAFGAWLTLGLAHGLELQEAARLAHAAGRVYVQHPHNRPPWPHEIMRDLDPVGGKLISGGGQLADVRTSITGRVVFTNGRFSLPHAGHSWLLSWAKRQGDVLVVGVNSNTSAFRCKPGALCLPLEDRLQFLCSQQSVDWVVVFEEDTPQRLIEALKPSLVVKGSDFAGKTVIGSDVCEVLIAPEGPFKKHASDLVREIRG